MVKYDLLKTYRIAALSSRTPADGFVFTAHGEAHKAETKKGAKVMSRYGRGLRDTSRDGSIAQRLEQRTHNPQSPVTGRADNDLELQAFTLVEELDGETRAALLHALLCRMTLGEIAQAVQLDDRAADV